MLWWGQVSSGFTIAGRLPRPRMVGFWYQIVAAKDQNPLVSRGFFKRRRKWREGSKPDPRVNWYWVKELWKWAPKYPNMRCATKLFYIFTCWDEKGEYNVVHFSCTELASGQSTKVFSSGENSHMLEQPLAIVSRYWSEIRWHCLFSLSLECVRHLRPLSSRYVKLQLHLLAFFFQLQQTNGRGPCAQLVAEVSVDGEKSDQQGFQSTLGHETSFFARRIRKQLGWSEVVEFSILDAENPVLPPWTPRVQFSCCICYLLLLRHQFLASWRIKPPLHESKG